MSKSLRNFTDPVEAINKFGADAIRLFLMHSAVVKADEIRYSDDGVREILKSILIPWWNSYSFFVTYANIDKVTPTGHYFDSKLPSNPLDAWLLSITQKLISDVSQALDSYDLSAAIDPIVNFIDELNKYASQDTPKSSPILHQVLDIAERGRSLGIILFSAEQFRSAIHSRVTGNCSTHAYGRTNAIEIAKPDYKFVPSVYKNMMTRLKQGEYIVQNPIFRSLLSIKFPEPIYKQYKQ